jgi:hypothetical protein
MICSKLKGVIGNDEISSLPVVLVDLIRRIAGMAAEAPMRRMARIMVTMQRHLGWQRLDMDDRKSAEKDVRDELVLFLMMMMMTLHSIVSIRSLWFFILNDTGLYVSTTAAFGFLCSSERRSHTWLWVKRESVRWRDLWSGSGKDCSSVTSPANSLDVLSFVYQSNNIGTSRHRENSGHITERCTDGFCSEET